MFAQTRLVEAEPPNSCPRTLSYDAANDFVALLKMIYLPGFAVLPTSYQIFPLTVCLSTNSQNGTKCQNSPHFHSSSETSQRDTKCARSDPRYLRSSAMHTQILLKGSPHPSRSGRTPSADVVLTRTRSSTSLCNRGSRPCYRRHTTWDSTSSLMDRSLLRNATLPPEIPRSTITGLTGLHELELNETHRMIFERKATPPCSISFSLSGTPTGPATLEAYRRVFRRIVGSSQLGTKRSPRLPFNLCKFRSVYRVHRAPV